MLTLLVPNVLRQRIVDLDGVGVVVFLGRRFNDLNRLICGESLITSSFSRSLSLVLLLMIVPSILSSWWSMPPALSMLPLLPSLKTLAGRCDA